MQMTSVSDGASVAFERKEYSWSNTGEDCLICAFSCGFAPCGLCKSQKLVLEPEEAVLTTMDMCTTNIQRRPYGELGSVSAAWTGRQGAAAWSP